MELPDIETASLTEKISAVAGHLVALSEYCTKIRNAVPVETIMARMGDPQADLAMRADVTLLVLADAVRSLLPSPQVDSLPPVAVVE